MKSYFSKIKQNQGKSQELIEIEDFEPKVEPEILADTVTTIAPTENFSSPKQYSKAIKTQTTNRLFFSNILILHNTIVELWVTKEFI